MRSSSRIAIFIACLGLFGLAAFTAGRRTKEIGIRKVFGARGRDVVFLLLWQFSIPVLIANLIAWPLPGTICTAGWKASPIASRSARFISWASAWPRWLIAWVTVLTHALRVARANPINALRYE